MMSHQAKNRNTSRSIGHIRTGNEHSNGRAQLPPVHTTKAEHNIAEGMIVSSMTVPPQKPPVGSARKVSVVPEVKLRSNNSPESTNKKAVEEVERLLKEKDKIIKEKEKENKDKTLIVKNKDQEISSLTVSLN